MAPDLKAVHEDGSPPFDPAGLTVLVTGGGVSGFAAADALAERGARVTLVDGADPAPGSALFERLKVLDILGVDVRAGSAYVAALPDDPPDLVVTSPGWRPGQPMLAAAAAADIPVWGEVELAWRLRGPGAAPWLTLTGSNGKTTTVQMLTAMLRAAGLRACSAGNVGTPILEAVLHPEPYDVIAVELSSFQLHWSTSISPLASACLNVAPDHLDWHGSFAAYRAAKGRVYERTRVACVYNVEDPVTEQLVREADVIEGARAIGFTLGVPARSMVGLVDDVLADRAFVAEREHSAAELGTLADITADGVPPPHLVQNALAAAALARAAGVPPVAVRDGLRAFSPEPHRIAEVTTVEGVRFVDDSKATNPHAARAAVLGYESVVWVAGGLLKGADVEQLVRDARDRLRAAVLIGADRAVIAEALRRHAPDVRVIEVAATDTDAMDQVVASAFDAARPGDVVLLAPAAASMDMFADYGARGDAFCAAVHRLAERRDGRDGRPGGAEGG
ncbi:UDP-N-acetylmuramoyl-L-alanine--D-glutamate ligase [Nostocoides sp. F2B08]|uniref:UDP-N-acetylmuramoyl-L-alanine--D-glutamate ligase n=1 Tax=Nostocoides sp. F2B08 TaxID=2653936 RepID=UPI001262F949|nr:UDP-N-acetylmuramoyl-L-alanine--D-glutamate ligase [Tetrasphaera sp. F2B08]KAB7741054.1 UDP-N-acetylmuramoyl-L-alanine--D-glutamate ligase [Tetrasphaera sp. F2B08]